tara:strand:+ start:4474 stop:5454 length:981 start_codon:yes stop_codon:yes gene_type:complete
MAVTTVTASLAGTVFSQASPADSAAWLTDVRNASSGVEAAPFEEGNIIQFAVVAQYTSTRGSTSGVIVRTFLWFEGIDTAIGSGTITGAILKISGSVSPIPGFLLSDTNQDTIIVESSAYGGNGNSSLDAADFSELSFSDPYSSALTSWTNTDYNSYTLNSNAISDMNSNGYLNCVIIGENYDFQGVTPALGYSTGSAATITSAIPVNLVLTYSAAATATNVSVTQSIEVSPGNLTAGTPVTYSISNPLQSSSYFTLETVSNANGFYDTNSPRNLQGTFTLGAGISNVVSDDYKAGVVVAPGGGNLVFTPTNNVTAATLLLRGTGA